MIQNIIQQLQEQYSSDPYFEKGANIQIEEKVPRVESDIFILLVKNNKDTQRLFVKIIKEESFISSGSLNRRMQAEYNCLEENYNYFNAKTMFRAVKPIAFFPEWHAIVTAETPGLVLKPVIMCYTRLLSLQDIESFKKVLFLCGSWLRDFHHNVKTATDFEMEGITLYLSKRLEKLEDVGLVRKEIGKVLRKKMEAIEQAYIRFVPSVLLHNDFIPGNILVDRERICVLDFSWVGKGCHYFDITAFWLELQRLGEMPHYSKRNVSLLQKAFLEGYGGIDQESKEFKCFELLQRVNVLNYLWIERPKTGWFRRQFRDLDIKNQLKWLHQF